MTTWSSAADMCLTLAQVDRVNLQHGVAPAGRRFTGRCSWPARLTHAAALFLALQACMPYGQPDAAALPREPGRPAAVAVAAGLLAMPP